MVTGVTAYKRRPLQMDYNTIFVGMDVHKEKFSLCCYSIERDKFSHPHTTTADYKHILAYIASLREVFGEDTLFLWGYETGCLGFALYHQLTEHNVNCVILAPTTMLVVKGRKKTKTDKRDARSITKCMAYHDYSPVHIPTQQDEQVKEYILVNTSFAVMLFIILTICVGLYFGTDCTRKCTWSLSVPISKNLISYLLEISSHVSLMTLSTFSSITTRPPLYNFYK